MAPRERFIVKTVYYRHETGTSKIYLIFDMDTIRYGQAAQISPNYIVKGKSDIFKDMRRFFGRKGVKESEWCFSTPSVEKYQDIHLFVESAEEVA